MYEYWKVRCCCIQRNRFGIIFSSISSFKLQKIQFHYKIPICFSYLVPLCLDLADTYLSNINCIRAWKVNFIKKNKPNIVNIKCFQTSNCSQVHLVSPRNLFAGWHSYFSHCIDRIFEHNL